MQPGVRGEKPCSDGRPHQESSLQLQRGLGWEETEGMRPQDATMHHVGCRFRAGT